jgi:hypothetical protein
LAGLLLAGVIVIGTGTMRAFAEGPPVPAGCTFDQANGVLTCLATTTTTSNLGPFSTKGRTVPSSETFGGFTGVEICAYFYGGGGAATGIEFWLLTLTETTTTTTRTERHGLQGRVLDTSSVTTSSSITGLSAPLGLTCSY